MCIGQVVGSVLSASATPYLGRKLVVLASCPPGFLGLSECWAGLAPAVLLLERGESGPPLRGSADLGLDRWLLSHS